jgi:LPS export ABC transporter protein LptC
MPVHSRNLLLFLALAGAALLSWWASHEPAVPLTTDSSGTEARRGYYLVNAELLETDSDGSIHSRILAERLERLPESEDFELSGIVVEYDALESDARWELAATHGFMPKDRSFFELRNVQIELTPLSSGDAITFETSELRLDAEGSRASTSELVTMREGNSEVVVEGVTLNLQAGTYTLGPYAITIRTDA